MVEESFDATVFTKNRGRLLNHEVRRFFEVFFRPDLSAIPRSRVALQCLRHQEKRVESK